MSSAWWRRRRTASKNKAVAEELEEKLRPFVYREEIPEVDEDSEDDDEDEDEDDD